MRKNIVGLTGILMVMSLTACGNEPEDLEGILQNAQIEQETTMIEGYNQDTVIELYVNVLRDYISAGKTDFTVSFIDLDDDSTKEMVVFFGESQADGGYLFTIENEEAIQVVAEGSNFFGQYGGFTYKEKGNVFVTENESTTETQISNQIFYYTMESGKAVCKDVTQSITQFESDKSKFYVNDTEVESEKFNGIAENYGLLEMSTVSYPDGVHVLNEQMDMVYNAYNNTSNSPDSSNENTYFISENSDFYQQLACNPIDQNYVIDGEAVPLEIWQSALKKCAAWNQQIDFTGSKLGGLLNEDDDDQLQNAIRLWQEYYQEEVEQNRELYGNNGLILGSMYTAISADVLMEKCKLAAFTLLSQEYKLLGNVSFAENIAETMVETDDSEYSPSPQSFCIEYSTDFEETLISYSIDEKNSDELEELIDETANKIEEKFEHDFTEHTNKYLSFIHALYTIENNISEDSNLCLILKENRLKLYAIELLNILYMIVGQ